VKNRTPFFGFYATDFLIGTALFTLPERGAYITLLAYQWEHGSIPGDDLSALGRLFGTSKTKEIRSVFRAISGKFERSSNGEWRNKRLEQERLKIAGLRSKRARSGTVGAEKRWQTHGKPNGKRIANAWQSDGTQNQIQIREEDPPIVPLAGDDTPKESSLSQRFERWWLTYPKRGRVGKGAASKSWNRIKPDENLTEIMIASVVLQLTSRRWLDGFIPNAATWLNQERWLDEVESSAAMAPGERQYDRWDDCAKCGDVHPVNKPCAPPAPMPAFFEECVKCGETHAHGEKCSQVRAGELDTRTA
jgi:uncharacterized protein YdaU (DUF1376 family)